jgi:hypothetical protein
VKFRVKQQEAFGTNPGTSVTVEGYEFFGNLAEDDFAIVVTQNSGPTLAGLWVRNPVEYSRLSFFEEGFAALPGVTLTWAGSDLVGLSVLPTGLKQQFGVRSIEADAAYYVALSTAASTGDSLVFRNSGGGASFAAVGIDSQPVNAYDATRKDYVDTKVANVAGVSGIRLMTQAAYDALGVKSTSTLYVISG